MIYPSNLTQKIKINSIDLYELDCYQIDSILETLSWLGYVIIEHYKYLLIRSKNALEHEYTVKVYYDNNRFEEVEIRTHLYSKKLDILYSHNISKQLNKNEMYNILLYMFKYVQNELL